MLSNQQGFTLLELTFVIVVLGILTAIALPIYFDLEREARISTVEAMAGSIASGAILARSKAVLSGTDITADSASVTMDDGTTLQLVYGFPDKSDATTMSWIVQDMGDFSYNENSGQFRLPNFGCHIRYVNAATAESAPTITTPGCN